MMSRKPRRRADKKSTELISYLPLYKAALEGQWKEARTFIDENPEAFTTKITIASETALHIAVGTGKDIIPFVEKMVRKMSPEELALTDQNGDTVLFVAAMVGNLDAAKLLVNKNPNLPNTSSKSDLPIHRAAQYGHKPMVQYLLQVTRSDIEPIPFSGESGVKLLINVIIAEFYVSFGKFKRATKLMHRQSVELAKLLRMEIMELDDAKAHSLLQPPLHLAANLGVCEIIEDIVEAFPPAIWSSNEENHNVFQLAVTHSRENVFNLIFQMSEYRHLVTRYIDSQGNNILHLAGRLPSSDRLNLVSGAALQMQRELQWFKAVEQVAHHALKTAKNIDGKNPAVVFTESHQNLVKEGEKWLKDTATSCTVAAALIATVVFAAAITIPGGNDQNDGTPLFFKPQQHVEKAFAVFGVFDAVSLFSSVASILMFLSILTSRYSEADFHFALPNLLTIGLTMLFVSITSMMIAFSSALYLVFGQGKPWRLFLVVGLAMLPVSLFIILQLPLLKEMAYATYGRGIFRKKSSRRFH
ncbi:hypothetical protein RND81_07G054600 [Saponaria officinalis]|uniref:PGG domain-containing protein n=1 Tax=Saponaria officinalis TaxID=3572 RepID=A0AAW1JMQ7_SAPOF